MNVKERGLIESPPTQRNRNISECFFIFKTGLSINPRDV